MDCGKSDVKGDRGVKYIYTDNRPIKAENINPYLIDAPNVFIESRKTPICDVPEIIKGSSPVDGGNILFDNSEYEVFIKKEPNAKKYIYPFLGAKEYLHNIKRWCLWIDNILPSELKTLPCVMDRVKK